MNNKQRELMIKRFIFEPQNTEEMNLKWLEKLMMKTLHHLLINIMVNIMILVNKRML